MDYGAGHAWGAANRFQYGAVTYCGFGGQGMNVGGYAYASMATSRGFPLRLSGTHMAC